LLKEQDEQIVPGIRPFLFGGCFPCSIQHSQLIFLRQRRCTVGNRDVTSHQNCTTSLNGRVIQRGEHQAAIDRNNKRVWANPDYYRNRQQIIEHQFGTLKRQWGMTHVLRRGKQKVLGEVSIVFTAYNLKRLVAIQGFDALMKRLKAGIP
jgi:hypothetical protein